MGLQGCGRSRVETRESVNELVDHTVASIAGGRLECASDIVMLRASELARAIKCRDVSCCEVMQAYLKHIDRLNPIVHALRLVVERAELIALAHHRDTQLRRGTRPRGSETSTKWSTKPRAQWLDAPAAISDWDIHPVKRMTKEPASYGNASANLQRFGVAESAAQKRYRRT